MALAEFRTTAELIEHYKAVKARIRNLAPPKPPEPIKQEPFEMVMEVIMAEPPPVVKVQEPDNPIKRPSLRRVVSVVSNHYGIAPIDIVSRRRTANIVRPRQVAFWLARHMTPCSLPEIGRQIGDRDHTTVLHGWQKIERLRASDPKLQSALSDMQAELQQ